MPTCRGYVRNLTDKTVQPCSRILPKNKQYYCHFHEYFNEFTDQELDSIKNNLVKNCTRCFRFIFCEKSQCQRCIEVNKAKQERN